jgi:hypothetical protein
LRGGEGVRHRRKNQINKVGWIPFGSPWNWKFTPLAYNIDFPMVFAASRSKSPFENAF